MQLDIEDDVLAAVVWRLLRAALLRAALRGSPSTGLAPGGGPSTVAGFRPFAAPAGQVVTNEHIDQLRDQVGL